MSALRLLCVAVALLAAGGASLAQRGDGRSGGGERYGGGAGGGGTPGEFDFYVLALSWSPGFCEAAGDQRGSRQCERGRNLGFVVHGLWPQYERGYPSNCGADRGLPRAAVEEAEGVFPDPGLARYEWRRHGTCSGLGPVEWVRSVRSARDRVKVPEALARLDQDGQTTPQTIEREFAAVNPGLRADMMSVQCRRGALQEVRICLGKDLRGFRSCPEVDRSACRFGPIRVGAPR